jgi:hypothetical protein
VTARALAAARRAGLVGVYVAMLLTGAPPGAAGHAIVLESSPAHDAQLDSPPARVVLRFNGKIEHALTRVTIEPAKGRPVPLPIATGEHGRGQAPDRLVIPMQPLAAGTWVLRYRVLSSDGHLTEGALRFTIR